MPLDVERTHNSEPRRPYARGFARWSDEIGGPVVAARLQAFSTDTLDWEDVIVNAAGELVTTTGAAGGGGAGLTDAQLRAAPVPVTDTDAAAVLDDILSRLVAITDPSDTQPVSIAGTVTVAGTVTANTGLSQPLTDTQLRASEVPVVDNDVAAKLDSILTRLGVMTDPADTQPVSIAGTVAVSGPATDAQLRATPLPVSGTVTANTGLSQPLTDAQLRAGAVPVSLASVPTHAVTEADGSNVALGATTDAEATGNGGVIALLKRLRTLLAALTDGTQKTQIANSVGTAAIVASSNANETSAALTVMSRIKVKDTAQAAGSQAVDVTGDATFGVDVDVTRVGTPGGSAFSVASGTAAAPAASAVIADTGALAAGTYEVRVNLASMDTLAVGKGMVVEHRNAANGATNKHLGGCTAGQAVDDIYIPRYTVAANERIRVIAGTAAGAASSLYVASIAYRAIT